MRHETGWRSASLLGLVIVAGCSTNDKPPVPPPLPPPTRALVGWSNTVCPTIKQIDGLQTGIDSVNKETDPVFAGSKAESYITSLPTGVGEAARALKDLAPSGVKAADAYVASLVGTLNRLGPQLPQQDTATIANLRDEQKVTKARQLAAVVAMIKPQAPILARMVSAGRALASSYNLAPNCVPVKPPGKPAASAPPRTYVVWSDIMCTNTEAIDDLHRNPRDVLLSEDPRFARFAGIELQQYVTSAAPRLGYIEQELAAAPATGFKEADEYRATLVKAIEKALPELPERDLGALSEPGDDIRAEARQVARTLATVKPSEPDLPTIVARNPRLATSYKLAPSCEPPKPPGSPTRLPSASNGTDVKACRSGRCQVRISKSADVTVSGMKFSLAVSSSGVKVSDEYGLTVLGVGGSGGFGQGGKTVTFRVIGLRGTTAVLDVSTA